MHPKWKAVRSRVAFTSTISDKLFQQGTSRRYNAELMSWNRQSNMISNSPLFSLSCIICAIGICGIHFTLAVESPPFEKDIVPILYPHCYACHSEKQTQPKGDLLPDTAEGSLRSRVIVPGKPNADIIRVSLFGDLPGQASKAATFMANQTRSVHVLQRSPSPCPIATQPSRKPWESICNTSNIHHPAILLL